MALTWAPATGKHGIAQADAVHAMLHAVYVELEFDDPRPPADVRPTLYIGPQRDPAAPLLEMMVEPRPLGGCTSSTSCLLDANTWTGWADRPCDTPGGHHRPTPRPETASATLDASPTQRTTSASEPTKERTP